MANSKSSSTSWVFIVSFWAFIVIKVWGTALAAWSWWWILLSIVPNMWLLLTRLGVI